LSEGRAPRKEMGVPRADLVAEIETIVAADAPDEEALGSVVRLLHDAHPAWDWTGIYLLVDETLVIGPFAGSDTEPEHSLIRVGEGVCGTAVAENETQIVEDVRELDNYLACSLSTRSELVVLIHDGEAGGRIVGQFDVDSDTVGAFSETDASLLEEVASVVAPRVAALARQRKRPA
jgi:L-methionine (R)-S-oxide reductase